MSRLSRRRIRNLGGFSVSEKRNSSSVLNVVQSLALIPASTFSLYFDSAVYSCIYYVYQSALRLIFRNFPVRQIQNSVSLFPISSAAKELLTFVNLDRKQLSEPFEHLVCLLINLLVVQMREGLACDHISGSILKAEARWSQPKIAFGFTSPSIRISILGVQFRK
jgi:hypothetical protein